ncbi:MAG: S41 family peptidase [Brevundimonas sp.]|uniref:S41 family peptidase n=1 Tax=Brevundimonas sp. TaxID=1871086 RepID=UPI0027354FC4|nr:S41 family peptidase [Brevundimonas sp.]MDP3405981.1 S41 family peptidase [Brevundimonas sp.]
MPSPSRRHMIQLLGGLAVGAALPAVARAETLPDWSSDVGILRRAWETMHPGLYRYSTPEQITARLDGLAAAWTAPASFRDRFLALTRVTASIRCGHTYPNPYNGGETVVSRLYPDRSLVPFRFVWIDGRMVVTHDECAQATFPRGTTVTAIDGVATPEILSRLIPLARADGASDAKRTSLMEIRGDDRFETFDIHLPLVLPLRDSALFTLADGRAVRAPLLSRAERRPAAVDGSPGNDANPWALDRGPDGIARLTMPGWALYDSAFPWETWLGGAMDDLAGDGARGLIVDLRGNEGGLDCGNVILSRLIDRDLTLSRSRRFVRYRRAPEDLHPYLDTWDRSFLDWDDQAMPDPMRPGFYRLTRYDDDGETMRIQPTGRRFTRPVVVLCDAANSSATFAFAQAVKDNGLATLVGTTTGGNRRGINGGAFCFLRLPASGLEVDLPLIATFPDTPQPDSAIDPDVLVPNSADDIASGRDVQMMSATDLILAA